MPIIFSEVLKIIFSGFDRHSKLNLRKTGILQSHLGWNLGSVLNLDVLYLLLYEFRGEAFSSFVGMCLWTGASVCASIQRPENNLGCYSSGSSHCPFLLEIVFQ